MRSWNFLTAGCCLCPLAVSCAAMDDKTLNALVAISEKHEIKLILDEPNHGCGMLSRRLVSALQRATHELGVGDAEGSFVVKEQRIVGMLEAVIHQHRVTVSSGGRAGLRRHQTH